MRSCIWDTGFVSVGFIQFIRDPDQSKQAVIGHSIEGQKAQLSAVGIIILKVIDHGVHAAIRNTVAIAAGWMGISTSGGDGRNRKSETGVHAPNTKQLASSGSAATRMANNARLTFLFYHLRRAPAIILKRANRKTIHAFVLLHLSSLV